MSKEKKHTSQDELTQEEVEAAIAAGENRAASELKEDVERVGEEAKALAQELESAREDAAQAKERLARVQADWENFRKRTAQERERERSLATAHLVEAILPALDDMERALEHASTLTDSALSDFSAGVQAVYDKLMAALLQEGVVVIDPEGEPFDPAVAQAVGTVEDASVPPDTVVEVLRRGYKQGSKVIREAMVAVSVGGSLKEKE